MKVFLSLFCTLFLVAIFAPVSVSAQALPPNQPEQDCINAIPVCQGIYVQTNSYTGAGLNPNEINGIPSCLNGGEVNDVWYIFTVQTGGMLAFNITPINLADDYDWAVYDLTNNPCSDIFGTPALEVSCNWSGVPGITGANGLPGAQNNPLLPVTAGQTFAVNVSNWSGNGTGYTLDYTASTAVIFDNVPPSIDVVDTDCSGNVTLAFSENILCSSIAISDFTLTDLAGNPYTINSVIGSACAGGGTFEDEFVINATPPLTNGDYILSLVGNVQDNCGNVSLTSTDIFTVLIPSMAVSFTADTICDGQTATLSTVAQPGFTYLWSPGAIPGNSITVSPSVTTSYIVAATDPSGCVFTGSTTLEVIPTPVGTFTATPSQICPETPVDISFVGSSLPTATFIWDFDGGTILNGSGGGPYQIAWSTPGPKTLSLDIDQFGCASAQTQVPVTVFSLPNSDFVSDPDVCVNSVTNVSYSGNATAAANYSWDFDGGFVISGSGQGPYTVEWNIPGTKNICLIVEENGCFSTVNCQQIIVNSNPVVSIMEPLDQCIKGNEFTFEYTGATPASIYQWDLGEPGASSSMDAPTYSYQSSGTKIVNLTVTDINGCINSGTVSLDVFPSPEVDFLFQPVCFGSETPFTDQTNIDPTAGIQLWQWTFGSQGGSVDQNPRFVFNQYGTHQVQLEVISEHGCRDTMIKDIEVYDQPVASFEFDEECENVTVQFDNTSKYSYPNVSFDWTFGDAEVSTLEHPDHLYVGYGTFLASMTITTDQGCSDTYQEEVEIYPLPIADFTPDSACFETITQFVNTSSVPAPGLLETFRWDFMNGEFGDQEDTRYLYETPGIYQAELWIQTQHGCQDSLTHSFPVYPNPRVEFDIESACETDSIRFTNLSSIVDSITADMLDTWVWNFGDGTQVGNLTNPGHIYPRDGIFDATLTITSDKGCVSELTQAVDVWANPEVPEILEDTVCFGSQAFLLAHPEDTSSTIRWYEDLSDETHFRESYTYPTPPVAFEQTYFVESVSAFGCVSTRMPIKASLFDAVDPKIVASAETVEIPQAIATFEIVGLGEAERYAWDLGDGQTANTPSVVHEYERPGMYEITVDILTVNGCEVQLREVIEVKQIMGVYLPTAFTPNGDGFNDEYYIGSSLMRELHFEVYDRWGRVMFMADNPDFRWDGLTKNGKEAFPGVYVFRLRGVDYQGNTVEKTGTLTLIR
ncbi:MAG: PKD domain-containing protein [Bacteroidota bacterium]